MVLQDWLKHICTTESPDESIIAFNFGLFETPNGYTIYLVGSTYYDEEDDDWACEEDFVPAKKYCELPTSDFSHLKFDAVQEKLSAILISFMETEVFNNSFLSKATAITIGFDDGNLELIRQI